MCIHCHRFYKTRDLKPDEHRCDEVKCGNCKQFVPIKDHQCYMLKKDIKPHSENYMFANVTQMNYCTTRRELLAVICALQHFRHYLLGTKIILRTDHHSLKWLQTFKRPEGILARWVETLAEFDFVIEHRPGRLHSNVDGVSRPCLLYTSPSPRD